MSAHENEPMSQKRRLTGGVWPAPPLSKSTTQKAHNTSLPFSPPVGLDEQNEGKFRVYQSKAMTRQVTLSLVPRSRASWVKASAAAWGLGYLAMVAA